MFSNSNYSVRNEETGVEFFPWVISKDSKVNHGISVLEMRANTHITICGQEISHEKLIELLTTEKGDEEILQSQEGFLIIAEDLRDGKITCKNCLKVIETSKAKIFDEPFTISRGALSIELSKSEFEGKNIRVVFSVKNKIVQISKQSQKPIYITFKNFAKMIRHYPYFSETS